MRTVLFAQKTRVFAWLVAWVISSACIITGSSQTRTATFEIDEIYWIGSAYYYHLAFEQHDFKSSDWLLLPAQENPPIAKYAIGLGLAMADRSIVTPELLGSFYVFFEQVPDAWGKGADAAKRAAVATKVTPELREKLRSGEPLTISENLLVPARRVMIASATLTSLLILFWGGSTINWGAGLLASQLLLLHEVVQYSYQYAMADAVAMLFSMAAAFAGWRLITLEATAPLQAWLWRTMSCGILLGLACGAKMNALIVVCLVGAAVLAKGFRQLRTTERSTARLAVTGLLLFFVAFISFITTNPSMWTDLWSGLLACFREHRITENIQSNFLPNHLVTLPEKFAAVVHLAFLNRWIFMCMALLAACSCFASQKSVRYIALWWLIAVFCVVVWIPFPFPRYVLPVILPSVMLTAFQGSALVTLMTHRLRSLLRSTG
jgi:hypothetical protein